MHHNQLQPKITASPDDVQMINVCKITTISQTVCILPSVPAHFLQLLRDGAGGSLLRTTRPNFKHFLPTLHTCLLLSVPVSPPWSEEVARSRAGDRSSQTPPPSTRPGVRAAFSASLEEPIRRSSMTMTSLLGETETFFFFFLVSFVSWCAVLVARRSLVCAGTWSEDARRAQPEAHRPTGERRRRRRMYAAGWEKRPLNC